MATAFMTISMTHTITIHSSTTLTSTHGATVGDGLLGVLGMVLCGDGVAIATHGRTGAMALAGMWVMAAFHIITDVASTEAVA